MRCILVVEDDVMLNSGLCYNLELDGYSKGKIPVMECRRFMTGTSF